MRRAFRIRGRRVEVRLADVRGRLVCIGLEIGPALEDGETFHDAQDDDLRPLQSAEIRLPLRELVDLALETKTVVYPAPEGDVITEEALELLNHMMTVADVTLAERKRTGRPPLYGRDHFEKVAQIYESHRAKGGRTPTKAVADEMKTSKATAAKWVARARSPEFGLLGAYQEEGKRDERARP
jgi:hypothetical protein